MKENILDKKFMANPQLQPFYFFRNNMLDIVKLAAGGNEELALAGRNLVYLSWAKWGWALLRNLERNEAE